MKAPLHPGRGTYSNVFKGTYKGHDVAIKVLKVRVDQRSPQTRTQVKMEDDGIDPKAARDFEHECMILR